ncbi:hypothetical protein [Sphaerotilus uruguayifluvii]|uniref:Secreted protein n=1 Tax=Sphaerotilus uruguayifluvii TaxID=2735897 RepID=A0ABX2G136_9BURK|nr:hypothetical protein [Leptothrix sp. C29]NRT55134.1 hypothetical protein [Leptothrix sp. C29]
MTKLPVLTRPAPALSSALSLALLLLVPGAARAHDYPTVDRVLYVQDCLRAHPGPAFEMINKCSCAVDRIAEAVPHEEYLTMLTAFNANTIGGERGSAIRDAEPMQQLVRRFRELQGRAKKACFITP